MPATANPGYALNSSSEDEHERLSRQADWYAPFTRRLRADTGAVGRVTFWPTVVGAYARQPRG